MTSLLDVLKRKIAKKVVLGSENGSPNAYNQSKTVVMDVTVPADGSCHALKDGVAACKAHALRGKLYCRGHDPDYRQERLAASAKGGVGKRGYRKRREWADRTEAEIAAMRADTLRLEALKRDNPAAFEEWRRCAVGTSSPSATRPPPGPPTSSSVPTLDTTPKTQDAGNSLGPKLSTSTSSTNLPSDGKLRETYIAVPERVLSRHGDSVPAWVRELALKSPTNLGASSASPEPPAAAPVPPKPPIPFPFRVQGRSGVWCVTSETEAYQEPLSLTLYDIKDLATLDPTAYSQIMDYFRRCRA